MARSSMTPFADLIGEAGGLLAIGPMMAKQAEQFWRAQDGFWADLEAYNRGWFSRRHEAAATAMEVVHEVGGNGADPTAAMRSMIDWQQQSMLRLHADAEQWAELCSRAVRRIMTAELDAGRETMDEVAKRTRAEAMQHATPV